jgi:threonine/homoserine/homoserine lactone efflux protein
MTTSASDLALYALALFALFLTPGPVWLALIARALSGGFRGAWPLALGVAVGDAIWPLLAVLGVSYLAGALTGALAVLKWVAAGVFIVMGALVIRAADRTVAADSRLTRPGLWAGFAAGLAVILGNPKAILFYAGVLPGFFDLAAFTAADIAAVVALSMVVPLLGNLLMGLFIGRARRLLSSPRAMRRANLASGAILIAVGLAIPFT